MNALVSAVDSASTGPTERSETILDMSEMQMQEFMEAEEVNGYFSKVFPRWFYFENITGNNCLCFDWQKNASIVT